MTAPNLGIDPEDLSLDIIPQIEKSFGFSFQENDLANVRTFGQLCAAVQANLSGKPATDCTSQQAFYKARQAVRKYSLAENLSPSTALRDILPSSRRQQRRVVACIEQELGMELGILGMSSRQAGVGCLALLASVGCLFVTPLLAVAGLAVAIIWFRLASRFGTTLSVHTMRDLAERMSTRHYRASRRDPQTVNPQEITGRMQQLFSRDYGIELHELTPDAII